MIISPQNPAASDPDLEGWTKADVEGMLGNFNKVFVAKMANTSMSFDNQYPDGDAVDAAVDPVFGSQGYNIEQPWVERGSGTGPQRTTDPFGGQIAKPVEK